MPSFASLGLAVVLVAGAPAALAQTDTAAATETESLPAGMDLIRKHAEAIGGAKALEAITALKFTGAFAIEAMGLTGDITIIEAAPNSQLITVSLTGFGEIVQGTNGTLAWGSTQPGNPPQILDSETAQEMINRSDFFERWDADRVATEAKTTGTEAIDGANCYRVEVTSPHGTHSVMFFDAETGLKRRTIRKTDEGMTGQTTTYSDYKDIDGFKFPFTLEITNPQADQKVTIDEVTINPELPESQFVPPSDF